jgi:lysophospholipase L1-like esterase
MNAKGVARGHKLLLATFGILCAFALIEIGLRLSVGDDYQVRFNTEAPSDTGRWVSHPFLPYTGRPNASYDFYNSHAGLTEHIQTNSYGFRSHEFPVTKRPEDFFVLCLGGSTTYGYSDSNETTWPEQLERKLAQHYPDRHVVVFNLGLDMATSVVSVVNLALVGAHLQPDLIINYDGVNDLWAIGTQNFRTDHAHIYNDLDPSKVYRGIERSLPRWMLSSYAVAYAVGATDMLFRLNDLAAVARKQRIEDPDRFKGIDATLENFRTMHSIAHGKGAEIIFSTIQFRDGEGELGKRLNDTFRTFFDANGYHYVDQERLIPDHDATINVDEVHFTAKGDGLMADNYFAYIVEHALVPPVGQ